MSGNMGVESIAGFVDTAELPDSQLTDDGKSHVPKRAFHFPPGVQVLIVQDAVAAESREGGRDFSFLPVEWHGSH